MTRSLVVEYAKGTPPSRKIATPLALGDVVACLPGDTNFSIDVSAAKAVTALDPRLTRCRASTKRRPPSMLDSLTHRVALGLAVAACLALTAGTAVADKCTAAKLKAIGKKESGLLACQAKVATKGDPSLQAACDAKVLGKFATAFAKAGTCPGMQSDCEAIADDCRDQIRAALPDGATAATASKCESTRASSVIRPAPRAAEARSANPIAPARAIRAAARATSWIRACASIRSPATSSRSPTRARTPASGSISRLSPCRRTPRVSR